MTKIFLLECGSNSLKVHFRSEVGGEFQTLKFPWDLGRDVFETGRLTEETLKQALRTVEDLGQMGFQRGSMIAIATEGLRDAENRADFLEQLEERVGLRVRVITGREEASLLAEGFVKQGGQIPAFLMDIGGGSAQLVNISAERNVIRESLPLGAIRLHSLGSDDDKPWNRAFVEDYIDGQLETACLMKPNVVYGTGGTIKAVAKVLQNTAVTRDQVDELVERVTQEGPPRMLKPARRVVFLPGLVVLSKILHKTEATVLRKVSLSVGRMMLVRILDRLGKQPPRQKKDHLVDGMRITNIQGILRK